MIVAVFRARVREDKAQEYYKSADEMADIARSMPGFVSFKTYTAPDGERVSIHEWESSEALAAWRDHPRHVEMQQYGRDNFYEEYTLYVLNEPRESRYTWVSDEVKT